MQMKGKRKKENGKWESQPSPALFQFPISIFRRIAWWFRQVSGDAAYENYLRSVAHRTINSTGSCVPTSRMMTREEFYLDMLQRRYTGVSRCC